MTRTVPKEYYPYMNELQAVDFVLVELTLYLDTHPDDAQALSQFAQFQRRKHALIQQFEASFGPLREFGNSPVDKTWAWNEGPWPWQV